MAYYGCGSAILAFQTKLTALKLSFEQAMATYPIDVGAARSGEGEADCLLTATAFFLFC